MLPWKVCMRTIYIAETVYSGKCRSIHCYMYFKLFVSSCFNLLRFKSDFNSLYRDLIFHSLWKNLKTLRSVGLVLENNWNCWNRKRGLIFLNKSPGEGFPTNANTCRVAHGVLDHSCSWSFWDLQPTHDHLSPHLLGSNPPLCCFLWIKIWTNLITVLIYFTEIKENSQRCRRLSICL